MRHGKYGYTLGRNTPHRKAMWRNMAVALFTHEQITTTVPKAKSLQPFVERLITLGKRGDLHARRRAIALLGRDHLMVRHEDDEDVRRNRYGEIKKRGGRRQAPKVVKHLFDEIAPRFADREGGYTRIVRLGRHRIGDAADLCVIQLVGDEDGPQVSGQYSRRREKANRRMEFAAQLRKGGAAAVADEAAADAGLDEAPATEEAATSGASGDITEHVEEGRAEDPPASAGEAVAEQPAETENDQAEGGKQ